jgi:hypothetical protein
MWTCSQCGERHDDEFDSCWKCAGVVSAPIKVGHIDAAFSQDGGARVGMFNVTWPFVRLSANREAIELDCPWRHCVFARAQIVRLSKYNGLVSTGLLIEHANQQFPEWIVFWISMRWCSRKFQRLKRGLEHLGYQVEG